MLELKDDSEIALVAAQTNCGSLQWASAELKTDRDFMLKAVKVNPAALEYASAELQEDVELRKVDGRE
eukprot:COSAG02_NODE_702_length_18327_cov_85.154597_14_plen_68_part_00